MSAPAVIARAELDALLDALRRRGYTVIGPTVRSQSLVYDELGSAADLPAGLVDDQDGGTFRLRRTENDALFAHTVGHDSLDAYEPPDPPTVEVAPRSGVGYGWTEAPRGMLWHLYGIDDEGTILGARIVPPTSQNQARIEQSLHGFVQRHVELPDDELRLRCEQAVRSYDPCISCATHFLRLEIDRA